MPIDPTSSSTGASTTSAGATNAPTIGKEDFLKLLVAQLKNQDPTAPTDMAAMTGQMTQFGILEQLTNISATAEEQNISAARDHAVGLLGRTVTYMGADGVPVEGVVENVDVIANAPRLTISGTAGILLGDITRVR